MKKDIKKKIKEIFRFKWLFRFLGMRQTKYGSNALLGIVALLGILILANYIAHKESVDWDLTKNKKYTLSDQTEKVLQGVDEKIKVIGFYQGGNGQKDQIEGLLQQYRNKNSNIEIEFVDPDMKPTVAREYGIQRYGTLIFEKGDKREQSMTATESDITSSILRLTRDEQKKLYFLVGHREKNIEGAGETDYSVVRNHLEKEGYEVATLSIVSTRSIPEDADLLVIAGPQDKVLQEEQDIIEEYLNNDGKLLALLDPATSNRSNSNLSDLLSKWGVDVKEGAVVDTKQYFWTDVSTPVVQEWGTHQITNGLSAAFFPGVKAVAKAETHPKYTEVTELVTTSENSWLEKNFTTQKAEFSENVDERGPISVATVVKGVDSPTNTEEDSVNTEEKKTSRARIVVVGDSDFASNMFSDALGNFDFFINTVNWLVEEEELISIRPKEDEQRTVTLTGSQSRLIFYSTVVGMPLLVIIVGTGVWMDRRKRKRQK